MLGLFSSCEDWGYSLVAVCGLPTAVASLVAGRGLQYLRRVDTVSVAPGPRAQAQ